MRARRPRFAKRLQKNSKRGFREYPLATIAFYGPDNRFASKMAVAIIGGEDDEPLALEKWFSEDSDIRNNPEVGQEVLGFIEKYGVKSVTMTDGIIGCPHEEGVDYEGPTCPMCPFWANRDRWTGEVIH